jgi:hypothetical protein
MLFGKKSLIAPLLLCIMLASPRSAKAEAVFQPERDSPIRAQLLDAVRPLFEKETNGPIMMVVRRLNLWSDWAFGDVHLQRPRGRQVDWRKTKYADDFAGGMFDPAGSFFLLRRTRSKWKVIEFSTGPTDVVWDGWRIDHHLPNQLFERPKR